VSVYIEVLTSGSERNKVWLVNKVPAGSFDILSGPLYPKLPGATRAFSVGLLVQLVTLLVGCSYITKDESISKEMSASTNNEL
jgi:hypothetical protein